MKKVVFIHYRIGERDGVSLEIEKRADIFRKNGYEVHYLGGYDGLNREEAHIVDEINIKGSLNEFMMRLFYKEPFLDEDLVKEIYTNIEKKIEEKSYEILSEIKPDLIFAHNVFSHGYNLPSTTGLIKAIDRIDTKVVCLHHDFWFEREKFLKPQYKFIEEILKSIPFERDYILKHQVINSIAAKEMIERRNITPEKIGDYWDYTKDSGSKDDFNKNILKDLNIGEKDFVITQATRITERKAIENAILFAKSFTEILKNAIEKNGEVKLGSRIFDKDTKVKLFFPNFVEIDGMPYWERLLAFAKKYNVEIVYGGDHFLPERINGKYSFWDAYQYTDIVTYPSIWEGFGNQFLEAVFFKKLPVLFEYPVFISDIKGEGYKYVSMGDKFTAKDGLNLIEEEVAQQAAQEAFETLQDDNKLSAILNENFEIAKKNHDESILTKDLLSLV